MSDIQTQWEDLLKKCGFFYGWSDNPETGKNEGGVTTCSNMNQN